MTHSYLVKIVMFSLLLLHFNNALAQSICIDSVLIGGSIKKYMNYSDFIRTGVKIDSILKPDPMQYADEPDSVIYVGSSMFFLDSERLRCDARTIDTDNGQVVQPPLPPSFHTTMKASADQVVILFTGPNDSDT